jgi:hypothetical protein
MKLEAHRYVVKIKQDARYVFLTTFPAGKRLAAVGYARNIAPLHAGVLVFDRVTRVAIWRTK